MTSHNNRNKDLQYFINTLEEGFRSKIGNYPDAIPVFERIFSALKNANGIPGKHQRTELPICNFFEIAVEEARKGPKPISKLTNALINIQPKLKWYRRPEAKNVSESFFNGHANAVIVGDGGFEVRNDVRIGVSLVAPNVDYPRHCHPPEELYIVLAPGKWMQNDKQLTLKNSGDLVHNPPNCWHAMQSLQSPLLAIWCLWLN